MKKNKLNIDNNLIDIISNSTKITSNNKLEFLRNIWYMTKSEQKQLINLL